MLWLERRVVAALTRAADEPTRSEVARFVDTSLAAMPRHLRFGVVAESVGLGLWLRLRHGADPDRAAVERAVAAWERSPIGVVRQYPRLLGSLVIFADYELAGA